MRAEGGKKMRQVVSEESKLTNSARSFECVLRFELDLPFGVLTEVKN
jgi:hypothetical protein